MTRDTHVIPITDHSGIADARRRIGQLSESLAFDEVRRGQLEIIVTELATNLHLHARGGYLLVRTHGLAEGIEVMAVDRGPGMESVQECMRDGYSTTGTAGNGLGAVRRLAHVFDIHSQMPAGTVVLAQLHRTAPPASPTFVVGAVAIALDGEPACGDSWTTSVTVRGARVALADGLGHGVDAAHASLKAIRCVETTLGQPMTRVLEQAHDLLAHTRGAAMSICDIDVETGLARFSGVGNVAGALVIERHSRSMVSHNGTLGHERHRTQEFAYPWAKNALLVMHSDGLTSRWSLDGAPGLSQRHPSIIAAVLHRDHSRGRDDVAIVVLREAP